MGNKHLRRLFEKYGCDEKTPRVTDKQFFLSDAFSSYLHSIVISLTGKKCEMLVEYNKACHDVAYTDGNRIYVNTGHELVCAPRGQSKRALLAVGLVAHECAHKRYLDFRTAAEADNALRNGYLHGDDPISGPLTEEQQEMLDEMEVALADESKRPIFSFVYHQLDNIIADAHDEACLCRDFGGIIPASIDMASETMRNQIEPLEDLISKEDIKPLTIMFQLLLELARYDTFIALDQDKAMENEYVKKLCDLSPYLEVAREEDDYKTRSQQINRCMIVLWPYLKDAMEESQKQQGGGSDSGSNSAGASDGSAGADPTGGNQSSSGQSPLSAQAAEDVLNQLKAGTQGTTQTPQNQPKKKPMASQKSGSKEEASSKKEAEQTLQQLAQAVKNAMQEEKMEEAVENALKNEVNVEIHAANQTTPHIGLALQVERSKDVSPSDILRYQRVIEKVKPYSDQMKKKVGAVLEELREGSIQHRRSFGRLVEAKDGYRPDGKFFANKKMPQDLPDMAIAVLVDQSGSMDGERLNTAMEAAVLLDDFATGLGIPVMVAGHNTPSGTRGTVLHMHTLFTRAGDKDKYRITQMRAGSGNRDGMALNAVSDILAKRPEEIKLLIIISDGQPADYGYGGELAEKDIQEIVLKCKARGIQTFAAAIGSDKERIHRIYGEGYLNISDLSSLPRTMVRLISKRLV